MKVDTIDKLVEIYKNSKKEGNVSILERLRAEAILEVKRIRASRSDEFVIKAGEELLDNKIIPTNKKIIIESAIKDKQIDIIKESIVEYLEDIQKILIQATIILEIENDTSNNK